MEGRRLVVPGWANRLLASLVPRLVPRAVLLALLDSRQGKRQVRREPASQARPVPGT